MDWIPDHGVEPVVVRRTLLIECFVGRQRLAVHLVEGAPELLNREGIAQRNGPKPIDDQGDAVRFNVDAAVQVDLAVDLGDELVDVCAVGGCQEFCGGTNYRAHAVDTPVLAAPIVGAPASACLILV